jgi:predicted histidine transporter YuiF (NhaC family)
MTAKETELEKHISGLILMIFFTTCWAILAEYFFGNSDYRIVGMIFGFFILYFIYSSINFYKKNKILPVSQVKHDSNLDKRFYTVLALEGIAIFVGINIIINMGKDSLIISYIALIVGLHFIPLAKIFGRKFDYYIGFWTTCIALIGMILINNNKFDYKIVNAFVCIGCALSTTLYGLKKVKDGNQYLKTNGM